MFLVLAPDEYRIAPELDAFLDYDLQDVRAGVCLVTLGTRECAGKLDRVVTVDQVKLGRFDFRDWGRADHIRSAVRDQSQSKARRDRE